MKDSKSNVPNMYQTIPAVGALNDVRGFNPLKLLRRVRSRKSNETVLKLALPYKKLWFRLANPNGRIRLNALKITEQIAIFEAQVYLNLGDEVPVSSFTASSEWKEEEGNDYVKEAQEEAMDEALSMAGFGIQFSDVGLTAEDMRYGSEIPLPAVSPGQNNVNATNAGMVHRAVNPQTQSNSIQQQTAPVQGTRPMQAIPPVQQVRPTQAAAPVQPTRQVQPAAQVQPTKPVQATTQAQGMRQAQPAAQVQSTRPMQTTAPVQGARPVQATVPQQSAPAQQARPVQPSAPQQARPAQAVVPPAAPPVAQTTAPEPAEESLPISPMDENELPVQPVQQNIAADMQSEDALPVQPMAPIQSAAQPELPVQSMTPTQSIAEPELPIQPVLQSVTRPQFTTPIQQPQSEAFSAKQAMQILQGKANTENAPSEPDSFVTKASANQQTPAGQQTPAKYTKDMPVPEILKRMTLKEAEEFVVEVGTCRGKTMKEIADTRAAILKFYLFGGYKGDDNIMLAAARMMYDQVEMKKAG